MRQEYGDRMPLTDSVLKPVQQRRAEALKVAQQCLRGGGVGTTPGKATDLILVADWIIEGNDE